MVRKWLVRHLNSDYCFLLDYSCDAERYQDGRNFIAGRVEFDRDAFRLLPFHVRRGPHRRRASSWYLHEDIKDLYEIVEDE